MSAGDWKDMFSAATEGDLDRVEYHVERGVDVDYVHPEILGTALVSSILAKREAVALYLLESGADPNLISDFEGLVPLQAARQAGLAAVEAKLLALGAREVAGGAAVDAAPSGWFSRLWRA
ncbi:MAG: ankyrin repeat domain-containing protein [Acidobacteriota bacterium]